MVSVQNWSLYGIFLFGQALQDGTMAVSAPLVAKSLGEQFSAAGMIIVFTTMSVAGLFQRVLVQRCGWAVQLDLVASAGLVGMVVCMLGAHTARSWMVLLGHILIGLHRSGHIFMRFAPLELNPGPPGLSVLARMCSLGVPASVGGPMLAGHLYQQIHPKEDFGLDTNSFALAFGGLALVGTLQVACCLVFSVQASRQREPVGSEGAADASTDIQVGPASLGRGALCLAAASLSWGTMLFITVPFTTISQSAAGLSLVEAIYILVVHDVMMWLPSSLTTGMISCMGAESTLCCGMLVCAASFALTYCAALYDGIVQQVLVWSFMVILGIGWNQMWLAVTALLKHESEVVQALTESFVNLANIVFLLITFSFTDPWRQAPPIACGCLATVLLGMACAQTRAASAPDSVQSPQTRQSVRSFVSSKKSSSIMVPPAGVLLFDMSALQTDDSDCSSVQCPEKGLEQQLQLSRVP